MNLPKGKSIILFDGICNYCNTKVNYIIKHDVNDKFRFATIQSEIGQEIIKYLGVNANIDSIILYQPGIAYYIKSEAVFIILNSIKSNYKIVSILNFIPKSILDLLYDYVAKNRYLWYGKKESCMIPTQEIKNKFLNKQAL